MLLMKLWFLWFFGCHLNRGLTCSFARRWGTWHASTHAASISWAWVPFYSYIVYSSSLVLFFKFSTVHGLCIFCKISDARSNSTSIWPHSRHHLWEKQYVVVVMDCGDFKRPHSRLHIIVRIVVVSVEHHLTVNILISPWLRHLVNLTWSTWDFGMDCLRYFAPVVHVFSIIAAWSHWTTGRSSAHFDNEDKVGLSLSHTQVCNCF